MIVFLNRYFMFTKGTISLTNVLFNIRTTKFIKLQMIQKIHAKGIALPRVLTPVQFIDFFPC